MEHFFKRISSISDSAFTIVQSTLARLYCEKDLRIDLDLVKFEGTELNLEIESTFLKKIEDRNL